MEKGFCVMTESPSGAQIAINADQVRYVRAIANQNTCTVHFGDETIIVVAGTIDQIVAQLRSVMV